MVDENGGPLSPDYLPISIIKKNFWNKNKHADDRWYESVAKKLEKLNIYSENDSSDFCSYDEKDKHKIITLLESMGMEYNNEISNFYNSLSGNSFYIKP